MSNKDNISAKIVILGEPAVGKTTLKVNFVGTKLKGDYYMTLGADIAESKIEVNEDTTLNIQIWDIAGQESFKPLTKQFLSGTQGAILVFDLTRDYTFDKINSWLEMLHEENKSLDNNIPFIIVGNKADLENFIKFDDSVVTDFLEYVNRHHVFSKHDAEYIRTSAKTGFKVHQAFQKLGKLIIENFETSTDEIVLKTKEKKNVDLVKTESMDDIQTIVKEEKHAESEPVIEIKADERIETIKNFESEKLLDKNELKEKEEDQNNKIVQPESTHEENIQEKSEFTPYQQEKSQTIEISNATKSEEMTNSRDDKEEDYSNYPKPSEIRRQQLEKKKEAAEREKNHYQPPFLKSNQNLEKESESNKNGRFEISKGSQNPKMDGERTESKAKKVNYRDLLSKEESSNNDENKKRETETKANENQDE